VARAKQSELGLIIGRTVEGQKPTTQTAKARREKEQGWLMGGNQGRKQFFGDTPLNTGLSKQKGEYPTQEVPWNQAT